VNALDVALVGVRWRQSVVVAPFSASLVCHHRCLHPCKRIAESKPDRPASEKLRTRTESVIHCLSDALHSRSMSEITTLLRAAQRGDVQAADRAYALLYADLKRVAHSRLRDEGHLTLLDTTALVHESYLRLQRGPALDLPDRHHFLSYASRVMRSVIVDLVRARMAERRGGGALHVTLGTTLADRLPAVADEVLRVHEALDALAAVDARTAQVVEMRYFGGLLDAEIAQALDITERTVQRDWQKARLLLSTAMD
jgi:RNA polymerase sigma factor (TIGR02999 family)